MPYTKKAKGLAGAELGRITKGKKRRTDIPVEQLKHMVKSPTKKKKNKRRRKKAKLELKEEIR